MIEARIFTDTIEPAKEKLGQLNAENKGKYTIIDTVFRHSDPTISLTDEFLRLREIPENIWDEKAVILAIKRTNVQKQGKLSDISLKHQFETRRDAEEYYEKFLKDTYVQDYTFSRVGWQYFLPNGDVVDLEIIEGNHPSIEFKSSTSEGIAALLATFGVNNGDVITGPSVVAVKDTLNL